MPVPIEVSGEVPQGNSCILHFPLTDYDKATPVSKDAISTATMTLYNNDTHEVINGREDVDVLPNFDTDGNFDFLLTGDDNQIQAASEISKKEIHVAVISITAAGATDDIEFVREFWITVVNQTHVANAQA